MTNPTQLNPEQVLTIIQQRFPREFEIATQQAYIQNLEAVIREGDEEPAPTE
jgi:hypothetical protein